MSFHILDSIRYIGYNQLHLPEKDTDYPVLSVVIDNLTTLHSLREGLTRAMNNSRSNIDYVNFEEEADALIDRLCGSHKLSEIAHTRMFPHLPEVHEFDIPFYAHFELTHLTEHTEQQLPQDQSLAQSSL